MRAELRLSQVYEQGDVHEVPWTRNVQTAVSLPHEPHVEHEPGREGLRKTRQSEFANWFSP